MQCSGRAFLHLTPNNSTQSWIPANNRKAELHKPNERLKRWQTELLTAAAAFATGRAT
jgi:hypothetical protein